MHWGFKDLSKHSVQPTGGAKRQAMELKAAELPLHKEPHAVIFNKSELWFCWGSFVRSKVAFENEL